MRTFRPWTLVALLALIVFIVGVHAHQVGEEGEEENVREFKEPPELADCRATNKGKWCTCRKLVKFVNKLIGHRLGLFFPACGRWKKKLYKLKQCMDSVCWCVHPKTGRGRPETFAVDQKAKDLKCTFP